MKNKDLKTWVEIDRGAIKENYETFRSLLSKECLPAQASKLMIVVKSNAYGHGMVQFAKEVEKLGADFLGVDDIEEAFELRISGVKAPILVFGYVPPAFYEKATDLNISLTISNFESLQRLKSHSGLKVHIETDTGLGRQGFLGEDVENVIKFIMENNVEVEGLYTHFAIAEDPAHLDFTKKQIDNFKEWIAAFQKEGLSPIVHSSASAETMRAQDFNFDMVRVGISIYGLWASKEIKKKVDLPACAGRPAQAGSRMKLSPVLSWKTIVSEVKELPKGHNIGYDLTAILKRDSTVVVLPIGYWHGYPWHLSKKGEVIIRGKKARVLGRVSMNMIVIDVTDISGIKVEDEAILIGGDEGIYISADELAEKANTINYEIVTHINPLIKRFYI